MVEPGKGRSIDRLSSLAVSYGLVLAGWRADDDRLAPPSSRLALTLSPLIPSLLRPQLLAWERQTDRHRSLFPTPRLQMLRDLYYGEWALRTQPSQGPDGAAT